MRSSLALAAMALWTCQVAAQDLGRRIAAAPDGTVRLSYSAREGVCGDGRNAISTGRASSEWEHDCEPGPVRVAIDVAAGRPTAIRTYIGGRWKEASERRVTDLGVVSAPAAADWFLKVASRSSPIKGDPILPAVVADSTETWPELLRIARGESVREVRKKAVFWLSQEAATEVTRGLEDLVGDGSEDTEIRKQAVFALSQLKDGAGVDPLIRIARSTSDPVVRKQAIFWLGQSGDSRALGLFEEILSEGRSRPPRD